MIKLFRTQGFRNLISQALLITALIFFGYYLFNNALHNLERQGIASGFGFLANESGFDIIMHLIDYNEESTYFDVLVVGLLNTILLSFVGIIIATILGFVIGVSRLSNNWLVAKLSSLYIEIFRNLPLLLQIFFWYFAVLRNLPSPKNSIEIFGGCFFNIRGLYFPKPIIEIPSFLISSIIFLVIACIVYQYYLYKKQNRINYIFIVAVISFITFCIWKYSTIEIPKLQGFNYKGGIVLIPELIAMVFALSIYTASFIAEIVRAGILSINKGQVEAARALGLPKNLIYKLVIIPQAMRVIIPPLTSQYLNLTKNSSLAAAIAYPDLVSVFAGTTLTQTGQAIEVIGITMSIYLSISLLISLFMNWYNKKVAIITK